MAPALLAVQVVAVAFVSTRLAGQLTRDGSALDRWLAGLVLALAQVCAAVQLLGAAHVLAPAPLAALHVVVAVVVARAVPAAAPVTRGAGRRWSAGAVAGAAAGVGVVALFLVLGLRERSLESDTVHYHAPNAGGWVGSQQTWDIPFTEPGYFSHTYPSNLEASGAWLMVPAGTDELAYIVNVGWLALLLVGASALARSLGRPAWLGGLGVAALAGAPVLGWTHPNSMMTDIAATAGLVAAAAVLAGARDRRLDLSTAVVAGLALGLSVGSKYTAFGPGAAVVVAAAVLAPTGTLLGERVRRALAVTAIGGSLVVFWVVRNWVHIGNPLFPLGVQLGGVELLTGADTPLRTYETPLLDHVVHLRREPLETFARLARSLVGPVGLLALAGLAVGGWRAAIRRDRAVVAVAGIAALSLLAFLLTPYTGGGEEGVTFLIGSQLRYAVPFLAFATVLGMVVLPTPVAAGGAGVSLAYGAWKLAQGPGFRPDIDLTPAAVAAVVAVGVVTGACWLVARRGVPAWTGLVVAAVAAVAVHVAAPAPDRFRVEAALAATARPTGPVLVIYTPDIRELMGREFQVTLVQVNAGGEGGEAPILDGDALTTAVEARRPALVAVKPGSITMPPGWEPPATWRLVDDRGPSRLYVLPDDR